MNISLDSDDNKRNDNDAARPHVNVEESGIRDDQVRPDPRLQVLFFF